MKSVVPEGGGDHFSSLAVTWPERGVWLLGYEEEYMPWHWGRQISLFGHVLYLLYFSLVFLSFFFFFNKQYPWCEGSISQPWDEESHALTWSLFLSQSLLTSISNMPIQLINRHSKEIGAACLPITYAWSSHTCFPFLFLLSIPAPLLIQCPKTENGQYRLPSSLTSPSPFNQLSTIIVDLPLTFRPPNSWLMSGPQEALLQEPRDNH